MQLHGQSVVKEDVGQLLQHYESAKGQRRVEAANALFQRLNEEHITDSLIHFQSGVQGRQLDLHVYYWMGVYALENLQYEEALAHDDRALVAARKLDDVSMESNLLNEKAIAYFRLADFPQAITTAKACLERCRQTGDVELMCRIQNTIAAIYVVARQPESALPYNQRSIELAKELGDSALQAIRYGMRAEIYHSMGDEENAIRSAQIALRIDSLRRDSSSVAVRKVQMAAAVVASGDSVLAQKLLEESLPYLCDNRRRPSRAIAQIQLGEILLGKGREAQAAALFKEALTLSNACGNRYHQVRAHHGLYLALNRTSPAVALTHLDAYAALKDSIYNDDMKAIMAANDAQLRNGELLEEKTHVMKQVRLGAIIASAVLILLLVAVGVLFYAYRQQRRVAVFLQQRFPEEKETESEEEKATDVLSAEDQQLLNRINHVIYKLMGKGTVDVDSLAAEMAMSNSSLRRKLFAITGYTPANYILRLRLDRACQLLRADVNVPIGDIASRCGFDSSANFSRAFRQIYHQSPSDYRRSLSA